MQNECNSLFKQDEDSKTDKYDIINVIRVILILTAKSQRDLPKDEMTDEEVVKEVNDKLLGKILREEQYIEDWQIEAVQKYTNDN